MITTKQLLENSKAMGRDSADIEFDTIEKPRYDLAQKKLSFKGMALGSRGKVYKVEVAFFGVEPENLTSDDLVAGKYPMPKDLMEKQVKVDCDCIDYTLGGCLKGNLKNGCALYTDKTLTGYKKKTDRQEKNPDNQAYGCKHIVSFIKSILEAMSQ